MWTLKLHLSLHTITTISWLLSRLQLVGKSFGKKSFFKKKIVKNTSVIPEICWIKVHTNSLMSGTSFVISVGGCLSGSKRINIHCFVIKHQVGDLLGAQG